MDQLLEDFFLLPIDGRSGFGLLNLEVDLDRLRTVLLGFGLEFAAGNLLRELVGFAVLHRYDGGDFSMIHGFDIDSWLLFFDHDLLDTFLRERFSALLELLDDRATLLLGFGAFL